MKKDEIAIFLFDPEKKDYLTRAACQKLLKEIMSNIQKNKPITVIVKETDDNDL